MKDSRARSASMDNFMDRTSGPKINGPKKHNKRTAADEAWVDEIHLKTFYTPHSVTCLLLSLGVVFYLVL